MKLILQLEDDDGDAYYWSSRVDFDRGYMGLADITSTLFRRASDTMKAAKQLGCKLSEIPQLGSREPGPFHSSFKVTRAIDGMITAIEQAPAHTLSRTST